MASTSRLPVLFLLLVFVETEVNGHGRLMDPPARNSMWRLGFPNPVNYNDNELFCGGYAVQWVQNGGKCGVCGDAYHLDKPRPHEPGGEFSRGTIVRHYSVGQDIEVEVELTANHQGRFEMYLCPNNNPNGEATQECFDSFPLFLSGTRDVRFVIPEDSEKKAIFRYAVTLPRYVTCSHCVVQWNYYTGNMWGTCPNGTESVACGLPETFRNCADVNIVTSTAGRPPFFVQQENPFSPYRGSQRKNPFLPDSGFQEENLFLPYRGSQSENPFLFPKDYCRPNNPFPYVIRSQVCVPTEEYYMVPGMGAWCQSNCVRHPSNCPESVCHCPEVCYAIGDIAEKEGANVYCLDKCLVYPSECPSHRCRCY